MPPHSLFYSRATHITRNGEHITHAVYLDEEQLKTNGVTDFQTLTSNANPQIANSLGTYIQPGGKVFSGSGEQHVTLHNVTVTKDEVKDWVKLKDASNDVETSNSKEVNKLKSAQNKKQDDE